MTPDELSSLFCFVPSETFIVAVSEKARARLDAAGVPGRFLQCTVAQTSEWFMDEHGHIPVDIESRGAIRAVYRVQAADGGRFYTFCEMHREAVEQGGLAMINLIASAIADSVLRNLVTEVTDRGALVARAL